ncbi:DUF4942 domain-containing protein (plasmid) [Acinetobacter soli]|nr:DUF4942 domain-containing protein [Acinetobacter soli]WEI11631.1 DUF4942 domain-containing protein [Acinetobacter soli]
MNMLVNIKREVQASELDFVEVEKLILQCEKAKSSIKVIYEAIKDIELDAYQIVSAITRKSYSSSFNTEESALKQISSCFWRKLTEIINLRNFISEKEYDALQDKIVRHEIEDFTMDNVNVFLESIWSTRHMAYARKVDSLFSQLSSKYKTNLGAGINPCVIIHHNSYHSYCRRDNLVDEVRFIARQLFGKPLDHTRLDKLSLHRGIWHSIDDKANSNMRCDSFKSHMIINKLSKFL